MTTDRIGLHSVLLPLLIKVSVSVISLSLWLHDQLIKLTSTVLIKFLCFFIQHNNSQVMFLFSPGALWQFFESLQYIFFRQNVYIFFGQRLSHVWFVSFTLFFKFFSSSFQTFPCLVKLFVIDNAFGVFVFFKNRLKLEKNPRRLDGLKSCSSFRLTFKINLHMYLLSSSDLISSTFLVYSFSLRNWLKQANVASGS